MAEESIPPLDRTRTFWRLTFLLKYLALVKFKFPRSGGLACSNTNLTTITHLSNKEDVFYRCQYFRKNPSTIKIMITIKGFFISVPYYPRCASGFHGYYPITTNFHHIFCISLFPTLPKFPYI